MTAILLVTGPIFLLIALGFVVAKAGLLSAADFAALGRFVVTLALPALLFLAIARRPLAETVDAPYMAAYLAAGLVVLGLGLGVMRRFGAGEETGAALSALGMVAPNSGFVGYPILLLLHPDVAGRVLALNMAVENIAIIPLALFLAERGRHAGQASRAVRQALASLVRSPLMLAIGAGALWSLAGFGLPQIAEKPLGMLAAASGAASLLVIGGALARADATATDRDALAVAAGKLLAHPLAAFAVMSLMGLLGFDIAEAPLREALLVTTAMPIMGIYPLLALRYGQETRAAVALVATTALSFVTIPILFALLGLGAR